MKYIIMEAKVSVNNKETWIFYYPLSKMLKQSDLIGFNLFMLEKHKIESNIIKQLDPSWIGVPVEMTFKSDKQYPRIKYITKIKNGDKIIKI